MKKKKSPVMRQTKIFKAKVFYPSQDWKRNHGSEGVLGTSVYACQILEVRTSPKFPKRPMIYNFTEGNFTFLHF